MKGASVLFVDDERNVLTSLERWLIHEPYQKRFASSGQEALVMLASEPVQVLVTDMHMPGMDGLTLLKTVKDAYPEMIRMALTAHTSFPQILESVNTGEVYRYLTKPLNPPNDLVAAVQQALEVYSLRRDQRELLAALAKRNQELEESLAQVRKLQGLLPICCGCKKIRDDQGYWQQLEQYISQHSEAEFSHGLCPDCALRLYPEAFQEQPESP